MLEESKGLPHVKRSPRAAEAQSKRK
jgi:hypothetical protein